MMMFCMYSLDSFRERKPVACRKLKTTYKKNKQKSSNMFRKYCESNATIYV